MVLSLPGQTPLLLCCSSRRIAQLHQRLHLPLGHRRAPGERLQHVVEAGGGDLSLGAGRDHRRSQRSGLLSRQPRLLALAGGAAQEVDQLRGGGRHAVRQMVHRISQRHQLWLRQAQVRADLGHRRAGIACGHVERHGHHRHISRKRLQFLARNASRAGRCIHLGKALRADRDLSAQREYLLPDVLHPLRCVESIDHLAHIRHGGLELNRGPGAQRQAGHDPSRTDSCALPGGRADDTLERRLHLAGGLIDPTDRLLQAGHLLHPHDLRGDAQHRIEVHGHQRRPPLAVCARASSRRACLAISSSA